MRIVVALVVWMTAWLLWSGLYKPLLITLGVISCLIVLVLAKRMQLFEKDAYNLQVASRLPAFWVWLGWEIIKSNLQIARIVLSPRPTISPTVIRIDALQKDRLGQAILGNSITLTPGSVTIDDEAGRLLVHTLTKDGAESLLEGEMNRRVARLTNE